MQLARRPSLAALSGTSGALRVLSRLKSGFLSVASSAAAAAAAAALLLGSDDCGKPDGVTSQMWCLGSPSLAYSS